MSYSLNTKNAAWGLFLLAVPIWGASAVQIIPSTIDGIVLDGAGAEGFDQQFEAHLAAFQKNPVFSRTVAPIIMRAKPFYVRVSNHGVRTAVYYVIRIELQRKDGQPIVSTITRSTHLKSRLVPGWSEVQDCGVSNSSHLDTLSASPEVRASIDAVVFDNGELAGPDLGGFFARLRAHQKFVRALLADLNAIGLDNQAAIAGRLDSALKDSAFSVDRFHLDNIIVKNLRMSSRPAITRGFLDLVDTLEADPPVWRVDN
jgi:hypothetical protein